MTLFLYNIAIGIYSLLVRVASLFNTKARDLVKGRKNTKQRLSEIGLTKDKWIWIHCASLGEFEQGRPLIEEIKNKHPYYKIFLTFFSPSGYNVRKSFEHADAIVYMLADTKANAKYFIETVKPLLAIFVKYEFWYHHLNQLHKHGVKTILISAAFRKQQIFFKWYGEMFRKLLRQLNMIFVQDETSFSLLKSIGIAEHVFISGDTRYDRVATIATSAKKIPEVESFIAGSKLLIAGSTWPDDEKLISESLNDIPLTWRVIIAPHEIGEAHLKNIKELFGDDAVFFSQLNQNSSLKKILIIDNIGMLSSLYSYGTIAYVGGGFNKGGIHNILEPAIFGLPVIFGPVYQKFVEANELKEEGFAFPISNATEFRNILNKLISDETEYFRISHALKQYMQKKVGAASAILYHLEQNNWI